MSTPSTELCPTTVRRLGRLHADQRGTISIVAVFAALLLTMLLGMVMNVGRHVDGKIRLQNGADAAVYSGSTVLARGMNTLAFTNHLLCDMMAMTAFMREARDQNAARFVPRILAAWNEVAPVFERSGFPKFERLGRAIPLKTPLEQDLVDAFSAWAAAASERILPLLEEILAAEMIPEYQRAVVQTFPDLAQWAAAEVARRDGSRGRGRGLLFGVLWRTSGVPVGGDFENVRPTLPAVDAVRTASLGDDRYLARARRQRREMAERYLRDWNDQAMWVFDREAKMGQFGALWRGFTCGHLRRLLDGEAMTNLPHVMRTEADEIVDSTAHLAEDFTFVGVAYWHRTPEMLPGLFRNPLECDAVGFAEARVFIPRLRLEWLRHGGGPSDDFPVGGVPGDFPDLPSDDPPAPPPPGGYADWYTIGRRGWRASEQWDLFNQNWTAQLVPATHPAIASILQTPAPLPTFNREAYRLPNLGGLAPADVARISMH